MEQRWEMMLPAQFREAVAALPVAFMPLGTIEWHGEHNALGWMRSRRMLSAARLPRTPAAASCTRPCYGGMGGVAMPATVAMEGGVWQNHLLRPWLEQLCGEFHRLGFRAIIILTGHYGHNQQLVVRETAARMSERLQDSRTGHGRILAGH